MNSLVNYLKQDLLHLRTATGNLPLFTLLLWHKNVRIVFLFRLLNYDFYYGKNNLLLKIILKPFQLYYSLMTNRYCIDLPFQTKIGAGLKLNHSYGIVVNADAIIGENFYLGHNVTIGSNGPKNVPVIGNNVTIFTGSVVIGNVSIGDNVVVGACSLVFKDIPNNTIVGGNSCKVLRSVS